MKLPHHTALLVFLSLFCSCEASYGDKYTTGNLEIYYTPGEIERATVKKLGQYFEENDLILTHRHSVRIRKTGESHVLDMILNDKYETFPQDIEMIQYLSYLENELMSEVFSGDKKFRIQITDRYFNPLR